MTGSKQMDATAILDYFAPLSAWLDEQLKGQTVGWWSHQLSAISCRLSACKWKLTA